MLTLAAVCAGLAGLLHVYIFVLESLRWEEPATRSTFGTTPETASVSMLVGAGLKSVGARGALCGVGW